MARTDGLFEIKQSGYISPIDDQSIWLSGISSYINFGSVPGISGYGIRDNAGTMQFKNSGGAWTDFGSGGGGGTPGGVNREIQYNNSGVFGGMAGITYGSVNGEIILDNALNVNALILTSSGTGIRKGIIFTVGSSSDSVGAPLEFYSGEGTSVGGGIFLEAGRGTVNAGGSVTIRSGNGNNIGGDVAIIAGTGPSSNGGASLRSEREIYLGRISGSGQGLVFQIDAMDKQYLFPLTDGQDFDWMRTDGIGNLSFQDSRAFFQYIGSLRGHDTVFTYDVNGNIDTKSFPSISVTVTYGYDVNGNIDTISDGTFVKTFVYDVNGNVTNINYA